MNQNDALEFLKSYVATSRKRPTLALQTSAAIADRGGHFRTRMNRKRGRVALYSKGHDVSGEARDSSGKWTSSGSSIETAAADGARAAGGIRPAIRALVAAAHAKASQLAGQIKHVIGSTKFEGASPLANGGVEVRTSHTTQAMTGTGVKPARVTTYAQIHPSHIVNSPITSRALAATHAALTASRVPSAPVRHPPIAATFQRGNVS